MTETIRPTKKQKELLTFLESFIAEHGYSPSYREIMKALNYNSVATVALHISSLEKRGHIHKRGRSARSIEVVESIDREALKTNIVKPSEEKWLVQKVEYFFEQQESQKVIEQSKIDELYVLIGALKILGVEGAAQSFISRLSQLKKRVN